MLAYHRACVSTQHTERCIHLHRISKFGVLVQCTRHVLLYICMVSNISGRFFLDFLIQLSSLPAALCARSTAWSRACRRLDVIIWFQKYSSMSTRFQWKYAWVDAHRRKQCKIKLSFAMRVPEWAVLDSMLFKSSFGTSIAHGRVSFLDRELTKLPQICFPYHDYNYSFLTPLLKPWICSCPLGWAWSLYASIFSGTPVTIKNGYLLRLLLCNWL